MASPLPHCPSVSYTPEERSTIELGEGSCRQTFEALASETARAIVEQLTIEPATASELATQIDMSIQNVGYHLSQLREAGLIVEAGVWYSARGKEMSVYSPRVEELVVRVPTPSGPA
jgi:DNA-binding transcriptional ArsR family regulator